MSVWRIGKIDAQTRALAEAAAKAAGLPLGVWLERAVMQRVSGKLPGAGVAMPEAPPIAEDEISPEMRAALEAADRRRRTRGSEDGADSTSSTRLVEPTLGTTSKSAGDGDELPSDPFAAPEPAPDDTPFENAAAIADTIELVMADETIATTATDDTALPRNGAEPNDIAGILADDPAPAPTLEGATADRDGSIADAAITTTAREPLLPPGATPPRRAPSALPMLAAGLIVILLGAGAGYYFLREPGQDDAASAARTGPAEANAAANASPAAPPDRSAGIAPPPATAAPAPSPSVETSRPAEKPAAAPPSPPAATVAPSSSANAAPAQSVAPAQAAASTQAALPLPGAGGPSIANLVRPAPAGPSVAAATLAPQPAPPAATAPPAPGAPPMAVANEALPVLRGRAEAGDVEAQVELGRRYVQGIGVGADLARALDYYRKSGAQNTPMAWHNLALLYAAGAPGLKADPVQARKLMTQAAELGQIESQYSLALMHLQGVGGPPDRVSAMGWMAVAARPNQPKLIEAAKQLSAQFNADERRRAQQLAEGHVQRISANLRRLQAGAASTSTSTSTSTNAGAAAPEKPGVVDRAAIVEMQKLMISLDLYGGAADGLMGPRTSAAIREFQQMAGMPVDGKPSAALLESLREIVGMAKQ